jgi:hypothetical protein
VRAELKPKTPGSSPLNSIVPPARATIPQPPPLGTGIRRRGLSR